MKNTLIYSTLFLLLVFACKKDDKPPIDTDDLTDIPYSPISYVLEVYDSFPPIAIPPDNPMTVEGVQLGRMLFYDKLLSSNHSMSCASCHLQEFNFTDGAAFSEGVTGEFGNRSAMSILDGAFNKNGFFWDGRAATLEEQALGHVENPIELHENWDNVMDKLKNHPDYPAHFRRAFGIENKSGITKELAVKAIAQFERTIISPGNSKFDKAMRGEESFTDEELNGFLLWIDYPFDLLPDAECGHCHPFPLFTTHDFHNNGLDEAPTMTEFPDLGLGGVTNILADNGTFRVPSLRNIELTAPYMHDGRFESLEEVLDHYDSGGKHSPNKNSLIYDLPLTEEHKKDIITFMKTFTDRDILTDPKFSDPF